MLKQILEALVAEYGIGLVKDTLTAVTADWDSVTAHIDDTIISRGDPVTKINRIKVVRAFGIETGLKDAKDWVERNYPNCGSTL